MQRAPTRPAPPRPVPRPGQVKVVRAVYNYEAQQNDELSFDEGDLLYITDMNEGGWWKARCGGKEGLVPSNYVEEGTETVDNPLHEGAKRGNLPFLQECLRNKVSVNGLDKAGSTAIHWASHGGHMDCLQALLAVPNCQINVQNKLGDTPLHSAAWKGHPHIVEELLNRGARTDLLNNDKKSALDLAKSPETKALILAKVKPQQNATDYGDEEDSD
ncbi:osteoclast-stimulating factor 1-like [Lineus longissimus]|uniref:osteoclast-stimulating factor 1-like n=1 Tax=Lineus longissimus TaxID=88925 RepID=UPI002B4EA267